NGTVTVDTTSYLPLTGGTLTGQLIINATNTIGAIGIVNTDSSNKTWDISPFGSALYINESGISGRMIFNAGGDISVSTTHAGLRMNINGTEGVPATSGTTQKGFLRGMVDSGDFVIDMGSSIGDGTGAQYTSWFQATDKTNLATNYKISLNPNGGNVGIGKLNPQVALDVVGAATFSSSVTAGGKFEASFSNTNTSFDNSSYLRLVNTGTSTLNQRVDLIMRWADGTYNGTGGISMIRESATARSGKLILQPIGSDGNNVEALTIASTGAATFGNAVTIKAPTGTAAPGAIALSIRDSGNTVYGFDFNLEGVSTGDLYLMRTNNSVQSTVLQIARATGAATFSSSVTAGGRINSGNGGGGTASLNAQQLSGDDAALYALGVATAGSSKGIRILAGTNSSDYALNVASYANSPILYARGDGNVGIGTTAPSNKLVVSNGGANGFEFDAANGTFLMYNRSTPNYSTLNFNALDYIWYTSATERMRITSGGLVGIGT
ncbi:MAG: hypothetical protein ACOVOV_03515, partial [Dolichospermum sp.]